MPGQSEEPSTLGCLILFFLFGIPAVDTLSVFAGYLAPYGPLVPWLGLGGFICGAALGAYLSAKTTPPTWWSSCHWAIYGLIGMLLSVLIALAVLRFGWRQSAATVKIEPPHSRSVVIWRQTRRHA
jgi:hypothetical protein